MDITLPDPHCAGHAHFEYDCIDCSDALERQRKAVRDLGATAPAYRPDQEG